jgi:L-histidine Nalpha-methyltransferase
MDALREVPLQAEILTGLAVVQKRLPAKFFYDQRGSALYDAICEQPEYYPMRTEQAILDAHAPEMAACTGPDAMVVELGSGSSIKTRSLLDALVRPAAYVPVDISGSHLARAAAAVNAAYPALEVLPLVADFTQPFALPVSRRRPARRLIYFPGSTIGNFEPAPARALLAAMARSAGAGGGLLVGVDLQKDMALLERAYNDAAGITAQFNLNMLTRLNREYAADFDLDAFSHRAFYNREQGRIEMHLVSVRKQTVTVAGRRFAFAAGETIHTENSYKYTLPGFAALAAAAGWIQRRLWTDPLDLFSVQYLEVKPGVSVGPT